MNIFITGGLSGLGLELAKMYKKEGHNVGVCSFENDGEAATQLGCDYFCADVRDKLAMSKAINDFYTKYKSLDLVFANAGINHQKASIPNWDRVRDVVNVNILGVINTIESAIEIMKEQHFGHLVFIASVSAFRGLPGMAGYGASKSFILSMAQSLTIDLKDYGISVSTLAPGFIKTPLIRDNKHKMPFLMEQGQAAEIIYKAIKKKVEFKVFPWPMIFISFFLYHCPRFIYRKIMSLDLLGLRSG